MKKRIFAWLLVVSMCITTLITPEMYFASEKAEKSECEVNQTEQLDENETSPDGTVLSYREGPELDTRWTKEDIKNANRPLYGTLPVSYSSTGALDGIYTFEVEKDYLTAVRDQNPYGSCWAHSAMCLAETSYVMESGVAPESLDYNEYHHVWYAYHEAKDELGLLGGDRNYNNTTKNDLDGGGNLLVSLAMLSAWTGASDATEEEYNAEDILYYEANSLNGAKEPEAFFAWTDAAHMENGYILTMPSVDYPEYWEMDMKIVKQAVMDYGAVGMSYFAYHTEPFYVENAYQYVNQYVDTNHAVTIVGWDDTIPAEAFGITPPGDGAWLVRNSWGEDWGQNGYFWLSYYDLSIGANAFVFDFTSEDNYDNNYQYDGGSNYAGYYSANNEIIGANAFVADSDELIEAVGLGTVNVGVDYIIDIYRNLDADALPNEGNLVFSQTGHLDYAGFHTIELSSPVAVEEGERYAIAVTICSPGGTATMCCDYTSDGWGWIWFKSYAKAGQSYLMNWDGFEDMNPDNTEYADGENLRIKSFTNERNDSGDIKVTGLKFAQTTEDVIVTESIQLKPVFTPTTATNMKLNWKSSDESVATVDEYGNVTALKIGTALITATTTDGSNLSASCMVNVIKAPVYVDDMEITYDGQVINEFTTDKIGATYAFGVNITPSNADVQEVTWDSSNDNVVTVDRSGVVTIVGIGEAIVTAYSTDGSRVSASVPVTVTPVYVSEIEFDVSYLEIEVGESYTVQARVLPENADNKELIWTSSDPTVASVDQNGKVTGLLAGETLLFIDSADGMVRRYLRVIVNPISVKDITILYEGEPVTEYTIDGIGEYLDLDARIEPENAASKAFIWESSNTSVATIDSYGIVTTVGEGMTIITARAIGGSGVTASCVITVNAEGSVNPETPTFVVEHYVMNVNGEYVLRETEYMEAHTNVYTSNDLIKDVYDDGEITYFSRMEEDGYTITVFIPKSDGQSVVKMYYKRIQKNLTIDIDVKNVGFYRYMEDASLFVETSVEMDVDKLEQEIYQENFKGLCEGLDIYDIVIEPDALETSYVDDTFSFQMPYYCDVKITFKARLELEHEVEHYVMDCKGDYVLVKTEKLQGYSGDDYYLKDFVEEDYDDGKTTYYTRLAIGGEYQEISNDVAQTFSYNNVIKVYYDRKMYHVNMERYIDGEHYDTAQYTYYAGSIVEQNVGMGIYGINRIDTQTENLEVTFVDDKIYFVMPASDVDIKVYLGLEQEVWNGWNQAEDGNWYYYKDGEVDTTVNGLVYNEAEDAWWYAVEGKADFTYTGLTCYEERWVYVENGVLNQNYTGLVQHYDAWFYVECGVLNWNYTGLVQHYGAWFYVEGGQLNWNYTGLVQYNGIWFYVQNGQLNWDYAGLVQHYDAWFYVEGGQLNWNYTGLTLYNDIWFYVQGGQLNWGYTGLVEHYGAWFYVEGGMLNWNYTGLAQHYDAWFYIENGQLNWAYTGLTCYNGIWFYVENGQLNWGYTGLAQHYDAWFYIENGVLNWEFTGLCLYNGIWFYIENGQLNWGYTGNVYFNGIWWYVENGILVGVA